VANAETAG
jgi:NFU1 iron-sulfur cluster scaffold homolog, mitochondrial